jgi:beta-glucosidase
MTDSPLGFTGFVTSDWGGTHSTVASANAGLDQG